MYPSSNGLTYACGQTLKVTTKAIADSADSANNSATNRSDRFSALVPATGHLGDLDTTWVSPDSSASRASSSRLMFCGSRSPKAGSSVLTTSLPATP
jgi:hypothetical protein